MRRLVAASASVLLLLVGCSHEKIESQLPPEEVLRNAARASLTLESARYELNGNFTVTDANDVATTGHVQLNGVLQDSGNQIQFGAVVGVTTPGEPANSVFSADVDVIVAGKQDLYVKLNEFSADGPNQLFNDQLVQQFSGKWWNLPSREDQLSFVSITPDPRLLNAQAQVVKVLKDRGMSSIHERSAYRYDVAIDSEKLIAYLRESVTEKGEQFDEEATRSSIENLSAEGEIWIDAETYYVQRLKWNVTQSVNEASKDFSINFTVDFLDHDNAESIDIPTDAELFTPLMFFDAPGVFETPEPLLTPEIEKDIMQQLLEEGANNPYVN